jgi:hypothetical protein
VNSESVVKAVINSLFVRGEVYQQLSLGFDEPYSVGDLHRDWDRNADREKESRTRFAQHSIKPDEVATELKETDEILGDPKAVERFVVAASERLGSPLVKQKSGWRLDPAPLPEVVKERIGIRKPLRISFQSPTPEGYQYIGRNHLLTATLSEYLLESALESVVDSSPASRSGVIRTDAVTAPTTVLVLRLRHLLETTSEQAPGLAEEVVLTGYVGELDQPRWLSHDETKLLMDMAEPKENVALDAKRSLITKAITGLQGFNQHFEHIAQDRATRLLDSHRRVRRLTKEGRLKVRPQLPPDVLGIYVLLPMNHKAS